MSAPTRRKILPDGSVRVLEINPRLGGTLLQPRNVAYFAQNLALVIRDSVLEPSHGCAAARRHPRRGAQPTRRRQGPLP